MEMTQIEKTDAGESLALLFKNFNRIMLLLWRLGLGAWINIWPQGFGRLMVVTHTGRKSRTRRQTPVNYAVINGEVYCTAARGVHSDWYQNIVTNPHVEIWLPDSWWAGTAEDVTDQDDSLEKMRMVIMACGFVGRLFGLDACSMSDEDFRNATRLFQDPDFDGEPVSIIEPKPEDPLTPPEPDESEFEDEETDENDSPSRYRVRGVDVHVIRERVQYLGKDGNLITESFVDYSKENLLNQYPTLEKFLEDWFSTERKEAIIQELLDEGVFLDQLEEEVGLDLDPFDLICHVAFDKKPLTKSERARKVKSKPEYFEKYEETAKQVIEALLDRYAEEGYLALDKVLDANQLPAFLSAPPITEFGRPLEIIKLFGGKEKFIYAIENLQREIYG